jgi:hypothetical protein
MHFPTSSLPLAALACADCTAVAPIDVAREQSVDASCWQAM